jgi:glycosyltransferase involved in cell wall biosynthesis
MKICYIAPWFPSKNAENFESQQGLFEYRHVSKLSERGHEFKVITMEWKGQSEYEKISEKIDVFRIPYYFSLVRYPLPHFRSLINKIKEITVLWNPDVIVYSHTIYLTALPSILLRKRIQKPFLGVTDCVPGINWFYGNKIVDSIGYIHSQTINKKIMNRLDGIRLLSSSNYEYFSNSENYEKISVITRGVDDQIFKPRPGKESLKRELGIKDDETIILFVGRLDLVKGVEYLISAAKTLISKYDNVKFLVVGDGSLKEKYVKKTKNLAEKINFLGFRTDIPEIMNLANVFVLTSLSEGACNVVLEACSSGLPVVATSVGEVPQIIVDGKTGFLIKPKDVNALIYSIEKLINDPKLAENMGKMARKRIEENYAEEIIYNKIEEFYNLVLNEFYNK